MRDMDEQKIELYLDNDGQICPFCESDHLATGEFDFDGLYIYQDVRCTKCGKSWTDEYKLYHVTESEDGDD